VQQEGPDGEPIDVFQRVNDDKRDVIEIRGR